MVLFDVSKYELPSESEIDMKITERSFDLFLSHYESAREKVGETRIPKMTQSFSTIPASTKKEYSGDAERFLIEKEMFLPEYQELHKIFVTGYYAIGHPKKPEVTDRRRKIFMLRYLNGLTVLNVSERLFLSRDVVIEESKKAFIQFCHPVGLIITKEETAPLIPITDQ